MQPYFIPYAGYFRLITGSDLFVIYDCVQFPRRGWVHRNKLVDRNGQEQWLTMPLEKASQDVLIKDLAFPPDAKREMDERLSAFSLRSENAEMLSPLLSRIRRTEGRPVDYIVDLLEMVCSLLGFRWNVLRSSSLDVPDTFRGQDRILEITRRLGGARYLNAPGGRDLYDQKLFTDAGIELAFLPVYEGASGSILKRLLIENPRDLVADINDWAPQT